MYNPIIGSTTFHHLLARFDEDLAALVRAGGCLLCGGALDRADYERKPRGGPPNLPDECRVRRSTCCRVDGCRRRRTPPSVVFLGRRVYLGAVVVLISALADGATPRRMKTLWAMIGAVPRTIARWRVWWRETFPSTAVGRIARGYYVPTIDRERVPRALLEGRDQVLVGRVAGVLRLLALSAIADGDQSHAEVGARRTS